MIKFLNKLMIDEIPGKTHSCAVCGIPVLTSPDIGTVYIDKRDGRKIVVTGSTGFKIQVEPWPDIESMTEGETSERGTWIQLSDFVKDYVGPVHPEAREPYGKISTSSAKFSYSNWEKEVFKIANKMKRIQKQAFDVSGISGPKIQNICKKLEKLGFHTYVSSGRLTIQRKEK